MKQTSISNLIDPVKFLEQAVCANTTNAMRSLLAQLPIVDENAFTHNPKNPETGWQEGKLHWIPLGNDRGNAGRIKLANQGENPIAERAINAMEALIELERRKELIRQPDQVAPSSPREAVMRYFSLPPLESIPKLKDRPKGKETSQRAREMAKRININVAYSRSSDEFTVLISDEGIGQTPTRMHETLLSLGSSDKGDKPYLIGLFGQGGSSTYAASALSWCVSRRAPEVQDASASHDGVGWTVVKEIHPKNRRDPYYAYLAALPTGEVLALPSAAGDAIGLKHGTRFGHLKYNFGGSSSGVMRRLYQVLNHILYNPVLPFELNAGGTLAPMYGNSYRLSNAFVAGETLLDKTFSPQQINAQEKIVSIPVPK